MALTKTERVILANQFRILAHLEAPDADSYKRFAEALSEGYSYEYEFLDHLGEEMSVADCRFVYDVLDMYDALQLSFKGLKDKGGVTQAEVKYQGFGGNEETQLMAYSRFIVKGDKFTYLEMNKDHNSHMRSEPGYRRMLDKWKSDFSESRELSAAELKAVIEASHHR